MGSVQGCIAASHVARIPMTPFQHQQLIAGAGDSTQAARAALRSCSSQSSAVQPGSKAYVARCTSCAVLRRH
jgi:hypothetical protein